jgi:hypothetical protein
MSNSLTTAYTEADYRGKSPLPSGEYRKRFGR